MKNLTLILMTVLVSLNGWSGGGVDVGNHSPKSFKGSFLVPTFTSEEAMVAHIQKLLPKIESASVSDVRALILEAKCSAKNVKFDTLEVITSYEFNEIRMKLDKEFMGIVTVELRDCKEPVKLPYFDHPEF